MTTTAENEPQIRVLNFSEIGADLLHDLLKLRFDIFILEQESLYPELDGRDKDAAHVVAATPEAPGDPLATLRVLGLNADGPLYIGRVAVRRDRRGAGLGRRMMMAALAHIDERGGGRPVRLGAQRHLEPFYASLGFTRISGVYDDGGIPHIDMERPTR